MLAPRDRRNKVRRSSRITNMNGFTLEQRVLYTDTKTTIPQQRLLPTITMHCARDLVMGFLQRVHLAKQPRPAAARAAIRDFFAETTQYLTPMAILENFATRTRSNLHRPLLDELSSSTARSVQRFHNTFVFGKNVDSGMPATPSVLIQQRPIQRLVMTCS
jgi:hypothetical protein